MTNVELYEALKGSIPADAARMIAEAFHPASDLATRHDIVELRAATKADIAAVSEKVTRLEGDIKALARLQQWMLGFFVPLWVGTFGTVIAVVLKG